MEEVKCQTSDVCREQNTLFRIADACTQYNCGCPASTFSPLMVGLSRKIADREGAGRSLRARESITLVAPEFTRTRVINPNPACMRVHIHRNGKYHVPDPKRRLVPCEKLIPSRHLMWFAHVYRRRHDLQVISLLRRCEPRVRGPHGQKAVLLVALQVSSHATIVAIIAIVAIFLLQEDTKSNVCIIFIKGKMGGRQVRDNGALATSERSR